MRIRDSTSWPAGKRPFSRSFIPRAIAAADDSNSAYSGNSTSTGTIADSSIPGAAAAGALLESAHDGNSTVPTASTASSGSTPATEWTPPKYLWRAVAAVLLFGQVFTRILTGRIHMVNALAQTAEVGPNSLGVTMLTAGFVGMVFTIQFVREFLRLGLTHAVGGVLALAMMRELSPAITAIIVAGRVGSAFAAELGTMQVSEQIDTLRVLNTDPVDYLVTPRVLACMIALPILTMISFSIGMAASVFLADAVYGVNCNLILNSAARALTQKDVLMTIFKSIVFGALIAVVSCTWGITTVGGAKGVGESTTSAVVISLVLIFISDFILSWVFYQGVGDSLKAALG